jgi:hypothetical protein
MKKRKLTEEERRAAIHRAVERSAKRKLTAKRLLVQRSPSGLLLIAKVHPNWNNPRAVAKGLAQEIFEFPSSGARELGWVIERRWGDRRFLSRMLIALGEYLLEGPSVFDKVEHDIAGIVAQHPHYTIKEITAELSKRYPRREWDTLEKRVRRLLKNVPKEYLEPPI